MPLATIEEAIEAYARGEFLVVVDDEDRENEGDLIIAADAMTMEKMNFMIRYTSGVICAPMSDERADQLDLSLMVVENTESMKTAFTVSVDLIGDTTTGISAADRSATVKALADLDRIGTDFARPGHIFPLRARKGGVLKRAGHTEAAVDLCAMADRPPVGVLSEIVNEDGTMARVPHLIEFIKEHGLKMITTKDLAEYRLMKEALVEEVTSTMLPTYSGEFKSVAFKNLLDEQIHIALVKGEIKKDNPTLVRVHSQCLTGDVFGSYRCDCGEQLQKSMEMIEQEGTGVLLYLYQEGRGIGIINKLKAYALQDEGKDTVQANEELGFKPDLRDYGIGAQILRKLGLKKIRIMTNNPRKIVGLEGYGLQLVERVPIEVEAKKDNLKYLRTKQKKLGHLFQNIK